jgi:hypothetical protein
VPTRCSLLPTSSRPLLSSPNMINGTAWKLSPRRLPMPGLLGSVFSVLMSMITGMTDISSGLGFSTPILCTDTATRTVNQVRHGFGLGECDGFALLLICLLSVLFLPLLDVRFVFVSAVLRVFLCMVHLRFCDCAPSFPPLRVTLPPPRRSARTSLDFLTLVSFTLHGTVSFHSLFTSIIIPHARIHILFSFLFTSFCRCPISEPFVFRVYDKE